jgi:hypothetical protein
MPPRRATATTRFSATWVTTGWSAVAVATTCTAKDQHGGPSDPQPGNIGGGKRDVLRTANFTGAAQGFNVQVGTATVVSDRYQTAPSVSGGDAISLFDEADTVIPVYFEM